jgi:hypothetical protein
MRLFLMLFSAIWILGCKSSSKKKEAYKNKEVYDIKLGESCRIYYSTNSCCFYCIYNRSELDNVTLAEDLVLDGGPKDCDGCNVQYAYVFKGIKAGTDTVQLKTLPASQSCEDSAYVAKYVIRVGK